MREPSTESSSGLKPPPLSLQSRMVVLSYLAYFSYYFGRKHLGVVTGELVNEGVSEELIAWVQTGFGVCYAVGQFFSGALGDRIGPRIGLCVGMILSGVASMAAGIFPFIGVMAVGLTLNGLFQSTGWPNCCKVVSMWVSAERRGKVMGFWMTCYIYGSLIANVFAGFVLDAYGWREVFLFSGLAVILVGVLQGLFLVNRPADRGYEIPGGVSVGCEGGVRKEGFVRMIREPAVLWLGFTYTGLKFVRYAFFAWLPYYLSSEGGMRGGMAAYVSNGFEAGGVLGLLAGGVVADRWFRKNRCKLAFLALVGMVMALVVFRVSGAGGEAWWCVVCLAMIGFFLYIADSIVSGTAAQDVAGAGSTASAAGIINGIGSTAQLFAGFLPILIKKHFGWDGVFVSFIGLGVVSCLVLLPLAARKTVGGR